MARSIIFMFIAALAIVFMVALFAVGSESWHYDYPHKIQYGLFPFWQIVDNGAVLDKRSSQILYNGLVRTALAGAADILVVYVAWIRLMRTNLRRNPSTEQWSL